MYIVIRRIKCCTFSLIQVAFEKISDVIPISKSIIVVSVYIRSNHVHYFHRLLIISK